MRSESAGGVTALLGFSVALIVYGSWLPLNFDFELLRRGPLDALGMLSWASASLQDILANITIYLPIGFLLSIRGDRVAASLIRRLLLTVAVAAGCGVLAETGQVLVPGRVPSFSDITLNVIGALIGLALARPALGARARISGSLRVALARRPMATLFWGVALLVVFAKLAPFDFVRSPGELRASYLTARWSPFEPPPVPGASRMEVLIEMGGSFFAFVLLGIAGALACRERRVDRTCSAVNTIAGLILLAVGVEAAQLLLRSHTSDAADVVAYVYGAAVGAVLGATVIDRGWRRGAEVGGPNPVGRVLLMIALVAQCSIIAGYALPDDAGWVCPSSDSIQWVPFYAQFQKPFSLAIGQMTSSFMWYLSLAVIAAAMIPGRSASAVRVLVIFLTVGVVGLTEAIQAFTVGHVADVTEPLLAGVAAVAGCAAYRWVRRHCAPADPQPTTPSAGPAGGEV